MAKATCHTVCTCTKHEFILQDIQPAYGIQYEFSLQNIQSAYRISNQHTGYPISLQDIYQSGRKSGSSVNSP